MERSFSRYPAAAAFPAARLRALQCSSHHSSAVCESHQYFMELLPPGEGLLSALAFCCSYQRSSSCREHPISFHRQPAPSSPPFPSPFCINKYCFAFQGLCIPRGPRVLKSPWVQIKVLTIFCSWSLKPARSRGARCYGPVLGSLGPSHQPCSSRMGDQAHPHPVCPPASSVSSSRMVNVAPWQLGASSPDPICPGPIRPAWPHPARSSQLAPEPRGEGRLFAEKVAF